MVPEDGSDGNSRIKCLSCAPCEYRDEEKRARWKLLFRENGDTERDVGTESQNGMKLDLRVLEYEVEDFGDILRCGEGFRVGV